VNNECTIFTDTAIGSWPKRSRVSWALGKGPVSWIDIPTATYDALEPLQVM
jgi:hypothetical protein